MTDLPFGFMAHTQTEAIFVLASGSEGVTERGGVGDTLAPGASRVDIDIGACISFFDQFSSGFLADVIVMTPSCNALITGP